MVRVAAWQDRALCADQPLARFFGTPGHEKRAKAICAVCPVQGECLAYGLDEDHGIWGGLNQSERRRLRRLQRRLHLRPHDNANRRDISLLCRAGLGVEELAGLCGIGAHQLKRYVIETEDVAAGVAG